LTHLRAFLADEQKTRPAVRSSGGSREPGNRRPGSPPRAHLVPGL